MALSEISPLRYGKLLAKIQPKVIETRAEFDRYVEAMEDLDRRAERTALPAEELALLSLLERLVKDYDDKVEMPTLPPHEMMAHLMRWRGLQPADLLTIFGTRTAIAQVLAGKREPSTSQVRKLAGFFHVSAALFL